MCWRIKLACIITIYVPPRCKYISVLASALNLSSSTGYEPILGATADHEALLGTRGTCLPDSDLVIDTFPISIHFAYNSLCW